MALISGKVTPITPDNADRNRDKGKFMIPDEVVEAFNDLIAENFDGVSATVAREDLLDVVARKMWISRDNVLGYWLNVECIYARYGWLVSYEEGSFIFVSKRALDETFKKKGG